MKNYSLIRFVKLNIYFLAAYSILTGIGYAVMGKFTGQAVETWNEILFNAAIFSLVFSLAILLLYRRTDLRLPNTRVSYKALENRLLEVGYEPVPQPEKAIYQEFKPVPPKAAALAGKVFVLKTPNFYIVEGPARYLKKLANL
ncbi:hypothetical protein [Botryobacter ruber]|uniref:hypothetical protein n=1 Tax=Botryobacter ruber TaxID=2171629 RepID=UPI000E0B701F|nr:hypothetical protein [Botryobacter ruber]